MYHIMFIYIDIDKHIYIYVYLYLQYIIYNLFDIYVWPNPWCRNLPTNRRKMLVGPLSEAFHSWLDQYLDMIKAGEDWNFELKVHTWTCTKIIAENDSDEIRIFYIAWLQKVFQFHFDRLQYRSVSPCVLEGRSGGAESKALVKYDWQMI